MKTIYLAAILMVVGGLFIIHDGGNNPLIPNGSDMLTDFNEQSRISMIIVLEEFADKKMDVKNPESLKWLAGTLTAKVAEDRRELDRYIAGEIYDGRISKLIEDMKNYEIAKDSRETDNE